MSEPELYGLCDRNAVHAPHDFWSEATHWRCVGQNSKNLPVWDSGGHAATNINFFAT